MNFARLLVGVAFLAVLLVSAAGQSVVTTPITLNLQAEPYGDTPLGGGQFYKYGIYDKRLSEKSHCFELQ
jgi:hypothetical protein